MATLYRSFDDDTLDVKPSGTTLKRGATAGDYLVKDDAARRTVRYQNSDAQTARGLSYDGMLSGGTVEVFLLVRDLGTNPASARVVAFATDSPDNEYGAILNTVAGRLVVYKRVEGAYSELVRISVELSTATYYATRLRVTPGSPNRIQYRVWEPADYANPGADEPGTWDADTTDSQLGIGPGGAQEGGWIGHVGFDADGVPVYYDAIGIGTGGDPAPMEPVGEPIHLEALSTTATAADARLTRRARLGAASEAVSAARGEPVRRIEAHATPSARSAATGSLARPVHLSAQSVTTTGASLQASAAIRLAAAATVTTSASAGLRRRVQPVGITEVTSSASGTLVRRVRTHSRAATYTGATGAILRAVRVVGSARGASAAHATLSVGDPLPHPTTLGVTIEDIYTLRVTIEDIYTLAAIIED